MTHPPVEELLGFSAATARHLATCPTCRQLATMLGVDADTAPADPYLDRVELERGGMGRIYRAFDPRLQRTVVLKEVGAGALPGVDRAVLRARLRQEAALTARLIHPGIVPIYEAGERDGEPWYAMPLVEGSPLEAAIAAAPDLAARLRLLPRLAAACETMAYAHGQGVVHRDLKPANLLLGPFGATVVIDWGLACAAGSPGEPGEPDSRPEPGPSRPTSGTLTRLGTGTRGYMPPEQAAGAPADPRADVYALGATLHHLLAGAPPPGPLPREAPPELASLVARAMAEDPAARFADAAGLAEELRRFLDGRLTATHRYGPGEMARHLLRRYRRPLGIMAVAALILLAVAATAFTRVRDERDRARAAERQAQLELSRAAGARASLLAAGPHTVLAVASGVQAVGLAREMGATIPSEALDGLRAAVSAPIHASKLEGHRGPGYAAALADGTLAISGSEGRIGLWPEGATTATAWIATPLRHIWQVSASPDGTRLLVTGRDPVAVIVQDGAVVATIPVQGSALGAWVGREAVFGDERGRISRWNGASVETRELGEAVTTVSGADVASGTSAAGGSGLGEAGLFGTVNGAIWRWEAAREPEAITRGDPGGAGDEVRSLRVADGALLSASHDGVIRRWGDRPGTLPPTVPLDQLTVGVHGRYAAFARDAGVFLGDLDGSTPLLHLARDGLLATPVSFLAEDRLLALRDTEGHPAFYDARSGAEVAVFRGHPGTATVQALTHGGLAVSVSREDAWLLDLWAVPRVWPHVGRVLALAEAAGTLLVASTDGAVTRSPLEGGPTDRIAAFSEGIAAAVPCGDGLLLGGFDGGVWEVGATTGTRDRRGGPVRALACAAGRTLVAAITETTATWGRWGDSAGQTLDHGGPISGAALNHAGNRAVLFGPGLGQGPSGRVSLWDEDGRRTEIPITGDYALTAVFSQRDDHLAVGGSLHTTLISLPGEVAPIAAPITVPGRALGWVGDELLTDAGDGTIEAWGADGAHLRSMSGHLRPITVVATLPDGGLLTGSLDRAVRAWTGTGGEVGSETLTEGPSEPTALAILGGVGPGHGGRIAVGRADGSIAILTRDPEALLASGCAVLARFAWSSPYCPLAQKSANQRDPSAARAP